MSRNNSQRGRTRGVTQRRFVSLSQVNDNDDTIDTGDGGEEEVDGADDTSIAMPNRAFSNNDGTNGRRGQRTSTIASPSTSTTTNGTDDTTSSISSAYSPYTYTYLWMTTTVRTYLVWIALASVALLLLNLAVFFMWLFRLIPGIPTSFLYYGFIWYIVFIFTGVLTLFMSCSQNKTMFTITLVILFFALIVSIFLNAVIIYQITSCFFGQLDPSCANYYFTQLVLLGLTLAIGIVVFVLFLLFVIMLVRIRQSFSIVDPNYGYY